MQVDGELGGQPNSIVNQADSDAQPSPNEGARTKKVTVQLSESMFQRLEVATERPGLGKSMVVETALERFLSPAPPIEGRVHEALDRISNQMARLEHEIAIIAETVALHARYHLTVTPPILPSGQREACLLGQQRFKVLAEQVERRVRLGQPLIRETIDRLGKGSRSASEAHGGASQRAAEEQPRKEGLSAVAADGNSEPSAAAAEGGSAPNFRNLPNSFC
ncbi:hypothetical protein BST63_05435 [Bradyrhizobium canariense]|uniref:CopG family transcriptional regulator n=1 Tax=Bradyrhizobium canariense TaxID=255045 RepID=A0ABX3XAK5_9BRAD|nr:hypothetical protein [Bradyrhizobium canariense]OSJ13466.1 hypothetical protein BSR47_20565 [Bradyrhizobium canariense]OSJ33524.1 hypothetical protein BST63_05435 [Bradyrhizobium canariense]